MPKVQNGELVTIPPLSIPEVFYPLLSKGLGSYVLAGSLDHPPYWIKVLNRPLAEALGISGGIVDFSVSSTGDSITLTVDRTEMPPPYSEDQNEGR